MTEGCGETLRVLDLSEIDFMNDIGLMNIVENCTNLTSIKLVNCREITDAGIKALSNCTLLEEINLDGKEFSKLLFLPLN